MTIKGVSFVSRHIAEDMMPADTVGMISVTDPGSRRAALRKGWLDVLRLRFHDIDHQWPGYVPMSKNQATQTIDWLHGNEKYMTGVMVHCEAGISRSAAIARFIALKYGLMFDEMNGQFYNRFVFRLLYKSDPTLYPSYEPRTPTESSYM